MEELDLKTIKSAASGEHEAFKKVYTALSGYIYSLSLGMLSNEQDASDAVQESFIKIYRNLRNFNFKSGIKTWAHRIAVNTVLNALSKRKRLNSRTVWLESVADISSGEKTADEGLISENAKTKIADLLKFLSPDERLCIILREIDGLSYSEIAYATKTKINTVRTRLKRAREALVELKNKGAVKYEL